MPDIGLLQGPVRPRVPPAAPSLVAAPGPAPADVIAEPAMLKVAARSAPAEFAILRAPVEPESVIEVALAPVVSSTPEPAVASESPCDPAPPTIASATSAEVPVLVAAGVSSITPPPGLPPDRFNATPPVVSLPGPHDL